MLRRAGGCGLSSGDEKPLDLAASVEASVEELAVAAAAYTSSALRALGVSPGLRAA